MKITPMDVIRQGSQPPIRGKNLTDKYPHPQSFNYLRTEIKPSLKYTKSVEVLPPAGRKKVPQYPECLQKNHYYSNLNVT
jgi:hypothetical protein